MTLIRLGNLSVLTDPFVTNGTQIINARSDPQRVIPAITIMEGRDRARNVITIH